MSEVTPAGSKLADVTVIVTSYNHQAYLEQCLNSIAAQTLTPWQLIIIDDCSQDDSANVIERWLVDNSRTCTFLRHSVNFGLCASLNEALARAEGKYLIHVSADDWAEPDRIERQVGAFELEDRNTAILVSDMREVTAGGASIVDHNYRSQLAQVTGIQQQSEIVTRLLSENLIPAPSVMMRTDLVREIGGYDETLAFEDYDIWLRLSKHHSIAYTPGIVTNYRVVDSGLTRNKDRRVSILSSEAAILAKHVGESGERDEVIAIRLISIAGKILDLRAKRALLLALDWAILASSSTSNEPWLKRTKRATRLPGGLTRLRKDYAKEFGLPDAPFLTKT